MYPFNVATAPRRDISADNSYGFQTTTKLRLVLSVALVDAAIKDSDIVSVFRALHNLLLRVISNPFLSLPRSFHATPAERERHTEESMAGLPPKESAVSADGAKEDGDGDKIKEGGDSGEGQGGKEEEQKITKVS